MFEFTFELITVAASNPHFIFLFCNLIIFILILVSLEPPSNSDHKHTATPIPPPPTPPAANENSNFQTINQTTLLQEISTNVLIDVHQVSYADDCNLSVKEHEELHVDQVSHDNSDDCNVSVEEHAELEDDELRRRVEEFIDRINRGWKAEKLNLALGSLAS